MGPNRSDRILQEWAAVARSAATPRHAPRRAAVHGAGAGINLVGALVVALVLVVAFAWLGNREGLTGPGSIPSATPTATATPAAQESPAPAIPAPPTPAPTASSPSASPTASLLPTCETGELAARITMWEGAAGSRIAHVQLTNTSDHTCATPDTYQPRLVDGNGTVLIAGDPPTGRTYVTLPSQQTVTTLVIVGNYCGPAPVAPVTLAFNVDGGAPLTAAPESESDTDVPPCNGPGSPGTIDMQPWRF